MQYIGSGDEMQRIDAYSIETMGIPGIVLMERAALAMEEEIVRRFPAPASVTIIAERGNNGGDGLALGRLLLAIGYDVCIFEIGGVRRASESYRDPAKDTRESGRMFPGSFAGDRQRPVGRRGVRRGTEAGGGRYPAGSAGRSEPPERI